MPVFFPPDGASTATNRLDYTSYSTDPSKSICHLGQGELVVGQRIVTNAWSLGYAKDSGCEFEVITARTEAYTGSVNGFAADGAIEGLWYRFMPIPSDGGIIDIRRLGVPCTEGTTGWHSRFANIVTWASANNITLTGYGVCSCTETVSLNRVFCDFEKLRFQGGTAALSGATVGPSTFFTAAQSNREITFTLGSPVVVNLTSHGLVANDEFYFGVSQGGRLPGSIQFLLKYYVKEALTDGTFTFALRGAAAINGKYGVDLVAVADGAGYKTTITTAQSADLMGTYDWVACVQQGTDATTRIMVGKGRITVFMTDSMRF